MKFEKVINDIKIAKGMIEVPEVIQEEIIQEGPNPVGITTRVYNKVRGSLGGGGGVRANTSNKINQVYQNVWKEYSNYINTIKGAGGTHEHTILSLTDFLKKVGAKPNMINHTIQTDYPSIPAHDPLGDDKAAAKFIYKVLEYTYQQNAYRPQYRLPTSL